MACHRFGRARIGRVLRPPFSAGNRYWPGPKRQQAAALQSCALRMLWHGLPTVPPSRPKVSSSREASETWHGLPTVPQPILECGGLPPLWPRRISRVLRPLFSAGNRYWPGPKRQQASLFPGAVNFTSSSHPPGGVMRGPALPAGGKLIKYDSSRALGFKTRPEWAIIRP